MDVEKKLAVVLSKSVPTFFEITKRAVATEAGKFNPISNDPHWGVKVGLPARAYIRTRPKFSIRVANAFPG